MQKITIVSGVRASGRLHVGNYLGALKQFIELQESGKYNCFFFIADLHGLTTAFDPKDASRSALDIAATYLALGIDPNKVTFFLQNHVLEHSTLAWIFNCITPLGELQRMTQFKDKSKEQGQKESVNAGLLTYPCLMAADILLYKPSAVPVGEDQVQHVELSRVIAKKFNNRFGQTFPEPQTYLQKPLRIMSLADPTKKMSKTGDPGTSSGTGRSEALLLDDAPEEIKRKLKKAVTASDPIGKHSPGVENLFLLMQNFSPDSTKKYFAERQKDGTLQYSELKETLAKDIANYFAEFREKKKQLLADPVPLAEALAQGASRARAVAQETLREVKTKIGLL